MENYQFEFPVTNAIKPSESISFANIFDMKGTEKPGASASDKADRQSQEKQPEKNVWEKNKPDTVQEKSAPPTEAEIEKAVKVARETFKNPLSQDVLKALMTGNMSSLDMILHDLRHDHALEKGEGKKKLQQVVDDLNKVLRYPVELVTDDNDGPPPELGLKFKAYHYENDPGGVREPGELTRGYSEQMNVTIWAYGRYEARTSYMTPRSVANLAASMGDADARLRTMLVQSVIRSKKD